MSLNMNIEHTSLCHFHHWQMLQSTRVMHLLGVLYASHDTCKLLAIIVIVWKSSEPKVRMSVCGACGKVCFHWGPTKAVNFTPASGVVTQGWGGGRRGVRLSLEESVIQGEESGDEKESAAKGGRKYGKGWTVSLVNRRTVSPEVRVMGPSL